MFCGADVECLSGSEYHALEAFGKVCEVVVDVVGVGSGVVEDVVNESSSVLGHLKGCHC